MGPANLTWNNLGGSGNGLTWDTSNQNWNNGSGVVAYSNNSNISSGDNVTFNDANNGHYNVSISGVVSPSSITFNNGSGNYAITGANASSGIAGPGALTKYNVGSVTLSTNNNYSGGTNVLGGKLILASADAFPVSTPLTVAGGATVDITRYTMTISNTSIGTINQEVAVAYKNGAWNGTNSSTGIITSSTAASDTTHLTAVGVATGLTSFEGITVPSTDVLVKYTYYGDTDLNGQVDGSDYSRIDNGYLEQLTGWQNGDFNYDGVIDGSDYTLIDNAYNTQGANLASQMAVTTAQIAAVPEPSALGLLGFGAAGILARRKRHR
jgi:autotransporter-associated beta strand protein